MKKHTVLAYALAPLMGLGLLGVANVASAAGFGFGMMRTNSTPEEVAARQQELFQREATLLGISVDDVKVAWATGKSVQTLAKEKGISAETIKAKIEAERTAAVQAQLQTLVSKGVITESQADSRLKFLASMPKGKGGKGMFMHRGFGL